MTVTNKYVLSGLDYNLNFFLLCVQVRIAPVYMVKILTHHTSLLSVLLRFSRANRPGLSLIVISRLMRPKNVHGHLMKAQF